MKDKLCCTAYLRRQLLLKDLEELKVDFIRNFLYVNRGQHYQNCIEFVKAVVFTKVLQNLFQVLKFAIKNILAYVSDCDVYHKLQITWLLIFVQVKVISLFKDFLQTLILRWQSSQVGVQCTWLDLNVLLVIKRFKRDVNVEPCQLSYF